MSVRLLALQRLSGKKEVIAVSIERPSIAKRVRALREARSLTQEQLAEMSGLSRDGVSRIERAERSPQGGSLERLASALQVPVAALFSDEVPERAPADATAEISALLRHLGPEDARIVVRVVRVLVKELSSPRGSRVFDRSGIDAVSLPRAAERPSALTAAGRTPKKR